MSKSTALVTTALIPAQRSGEVTSLSQIPSHAAPRCPICAGVRLTTLAMTLTDGTPVDFVSCHHCEHKAWSQDGQPLALDLVLAKATKKR